MSKLSKFKDEYFKPGEIVVIPPSHFDEYSNLGFVECDGSLVLQNNYPNLFNAASFILDDYNYNTITTELGYNQFTIMYANNRYVRGSAGNVYTSFDETNWVRTSTDTSTNTVYGIAYGNNTFVHVGVGPTIKTSSNANTWIARTANNTTVALRTVTFGNGIFLYAGNAGKIGASYDNGQTWLERTANNTTSTIYSIEYINNHYIYAGSGGKLAISSNSEVWIARSTGTTSSIFTVAYGRGVYVIGGQNGLLKCSTDTSTWINIDTGTTSAINKIVYNGMFIGCGSGGYVILSHNGIDWFNVSKELDQAIQDVNVDINKFVFVGNNGFYTSCRYVTYNANTEFLLPSSNVQFYKVMIKS